jgi:hypothetical protein
MRMFVELSGVGCAREWCVFLFVAFLFADAMVQDHLPKTCKGC